jgi:hypothetical protein
LDYRRRRTSNVANRCERRIDLGRGATHAVAARTFGRFGQAYPRFLQRNRSKCVGGAEIERIIEVAQETVEKLVQEALEDTDRRIEERTEQRNDAVGRVEYLQKLQELDAAIAPSRSAGKAHGRGSLAGI